MCHPKANQSGAIALVHGQIRVIRSYTRWVDSAQTTLHICASTVLAITIRGESQFVENTPRHNGECTKVHRWSAHHDSVVTKVRLLAIPSSMIDQSSCTLMELEALTNGQ